MRQLALALEARHAPTLENFVAGRNAAALAAVRTLAAAPSGVMYLWGAPGCGRSHLLSAVVDAVRARGTGATLVAGVRPDWTGVEHSDLVAVDDVERLSAADQVRLFDACNDLRVADGGLLAAGSIAPAAIPVREDLRTRLASGLAFQLNPLTDAEKAVALRDYARQRGLRMTEDVVPYLLTHLDRDMATQIAVVDALDRYSLEQQRPVTLPLVRAALAELQRESRPAESPE
jgi:DnaA-homolog protein